jgi:fucose permease
MQSVDGVNMTSESPFIRSRVTWLSYILMAYFGFGISLLGPLMPFIAEKMELTFTEIGYHFMLLGAGGLMVSLIGDKVVGRMGNNRMGWSGSITVALALFGIIFGTSLEMTLFFALLFSIGGSFVIMIVTITIVTTNPEHSTKAFSESNIVGGAAMIAGPLLVGSISASVLGWQAIAFLPLMIIIVIAFFFRDTSLSISAPSHNETLAESTNSTKNNHLPRLFWIFGALFFISVAIEFLISSWGANFLTNVVGYDPSIAASLISLFALAIVVGRLIGRRLLDYMSESRLLMLSLLWVLLTFPIYWLSTVPLLSVAGLFIVGLGIGNMSPLIIAAAMTSAGSATNRASSRLVLFPSLGNLIMLQLMGILADEFGIQPAYGLVVLLVLVAIVIALGVQSINKATASK